MQSFGPIAPFYDELMSVVPYRMWVGYYLLLLAQQGVRPRSILDVCCGTGTMCELLHQEGFEVTGIDLSPDMIAVARRKAANKGCDIRYETADACDFELGRRFDAALSFFDSLNNILEPERFRSALGRVFEHLEPGGSFVFDLNTAYAFEQRLFDQRNLRPSARLKYDWVGEYDPSTRIITVHMTFWRDGVEFRELHRQRAYDDEEVREMLREVGFTDIRGYASYTLDPVRRKTDRVHYAALKPA
ncbi:MAG: class I SAM-dependent methyltransferase [Fimbriimonadales bacterium]|nr:class I SAM-dependent methyltransferase [Fimbriimonadales bacterium]